MAVSLLVLVGLQYSVRASTVYGLLKERSSSIEYSVLVREEKGQVVGRFQVFKNEEVADALYLFREKHRKLSREAWEQLRRAACGIALCTRTRALLYENAVMDSPNVKVRVWEGQEARQAAIFWSREAGFEDRAAAAMLNQLCSELIDLDLCESQASMMKIPVHLDTKTSVNFFLGKKDEAADAVLRFALLHNVQNLESRHQLIDLACRRGARCSRKRGLLFSAGPIRRADGSYYLEKKTKHHHASIPLFLEVWEDQEPADAAWEFIVSAGGTIEEARGLADELCGISTKIIYLPETEVRLPCSRHRARLRQVPVRGPYGEKQADILVGLLEVIDEAEAYDLAYAFASRHGCYGCDFFVRLAKSLCSMGVQCMRQEAIAYKVAIDADLLKSFGWRVDEAHELEVWQGQQVADAVSRLYFQIHTHDTTLSPGEPTPRRQRQAVTIAVCSDKRTPRTFCERAEERVGQVYVEKPSASRVLRFNQTRLAAYDYTCIAQNLTACKPTSHNLGMLGLTPGLQVLGVHNDSEADRRGLFRGVRLRAIDGIHLESIQDFETRLADHEKRYGSMIDLELEIITVDESERLYPHPIEQFIDQTPSDAVYAFCHKSELLQPNYTAAGVQIHFLEELCASQVDQTGCQAYAPRFLVFEMPLDFSGLRHTLRYYAEDWPPCPDEYRPAFFRTDQKYPESSIPCEPAAQRAARHFCQRLGGLEPPTNCDHDLKLMIEQQLEMHQVKRWDEKATPDGVDLYAALGLNRDASVTDINASYIQLAADLVQPYTELETKKKDAEQVLKQLNKLRAMARLLIRRSNASIAFARQTLDHDFVTSMPLRLLAHIFTKENVTLAQAQDIVGPDAVDLLLEKGYLRHDETQHTKKTQTKNKHQAPRRHAPRPHTVDSKEMHTFLQSTVSTQIHEWSQLAEAVATVRTLDTSAQASQQVTATAQDRLDLAHRLLATADSLAAESNATLSAIEEPLSELSKKAFALNYALETLADETNRDFYDRPCRPVFGACCVRDAPDGGMRITCGS